MSRKRKSQVINALWTVLPILSTISGIARAATPSGGGRRADRAQPLSVTPKAARQGSAMAGRTNENDLLKVPPASDFGFLQRRAVRPTLPMRRQSAVEPSASATSPAASSTPHAVAASASPTSPGVVLDNTLGQFQPVSGPDYTLTASQGVLKGPNLFFSFSQFDLVNGQTASFTGPSSVQNVFARVTGGDPSSIDGKVSCTANLYLINPAGVMFGPDAVLDVKDSFCVTTADQVMLGSAGSFNATHPSASVLTADAPTAFGFLAPSPAALNVNNARLAVPAGESITIAVGSLAMSGGTLSAPGGRISIESVGSSGTATFDASNSVSTLQTTSFPKLGAVSLANGAVVSADGVNGPGGRIEVQSDSLTLTNAWISATTTGPGQGGGIGVDVRGELVSTNSSVASDTTSSGTGGDIQLIAGSLAMYGGTIETNASGTGPGGQMSVNVAGNAVVDGMENNFAGITALSTDVNTGGGAAGSVTVKAGLLAVQAGATINASTSGTGNGGAIDVSVTKSVTLDGGGAIQPVKGEATGIGAASLLSGTSGGGNAGLVNVSAASLSLVNGGQIDGSTYGTGNGGYLKVKVSGPITVDGMVPATPESAVYTSISAENDGFDNTGGDVIVAAGSLSIRDGNINAQTVGAGSSGSVTVNVAGQTSLDATGYFSLPKPATGNNGFVTGIFAGSTLVSPGGGAAGSVSVRSRSILMQKGALIDTSTLGTASAGDVTVLAGTLDILHGGGISSFTEGAGNGGDVMVTVSGSARLDGSSTPPTLQAELGRSTGIGAVSQAEGRAGNVTVRVGGTMTLSQGTVGVQATQMSSGGDLFVIPQGGIELFNSSSLSAQAGQNGGNIHLQTAGTVVVQNSRITASAGLNGGNLTIDPTVIVIQNSQLSADGGANGGKIKISAPQFLEFNPSITANGGPFGVPGTILVSSPDLSLAGTLVPLHSDLASHDLLLVPACGQMVGDNVSSFVPVGNGGTAAEPGGLAPAFDPLDNIQEKQPK